MSYKNIIINHVSSSLCSYNLRPYQKVLFNESLSIKNYSKYLKLKDNTLTIRDDILEKWNFSNMYLGNLEINKKTLSFYLDVGSKVTTIINPNACKIKINYNKILEVVLLSRSNQKFDFCSFNFYKDYNVFLDTNISLIEKTKDFFLHYVWIMPNKSGVYSFRFSNDKDSYSFNLVATKKIQETSHYIKKIVISRKL
jgi:hypothetical protein